MAATVMSPLLGALFLVAMLSAIMSTVNSILLVTGGAFAHDLYKRLVNPARRSAGWCGSTACRSSCSACVPFWFATLRLGDVQAIVIEQAKFIASFFFVPVVARPQLAARHQGRRDLGMVAGFVGCLAWTFTLQRSFAVARHRLGGGRRGDERAGLRGGEPADAADAAGEPPRYSSTIADGRV